MEPLRAPNTLSMRARAFDLIKELSFSRGHFVLTSGKIRSFYLDMKPTMFHPEGANLLSNLVLDRIEDLNPDYIGGLELGAVPLVTAVSLVSGLRNRPVPGFFVRKRVKGHGTKKLIEAVRELEGKSVVILDDVTTTGGSAMEAVSAVQDAGAKVVLVLSIVDREEGATESYRNANLPFDQLFRVSEFLAAS